MAVIAIAKRYDETAIGNTLHRREYPLRDEVGWAAEGPHEGGYFQMSVMGAASRSFAVKGCRPKLSSMVRRTL